MARRLLALLLLLLLVAACAGGDGPPGDDGQPVSDRNPSTAASTVVVAPSVQVADGASEIVVTVTVRNAVGQALDGIDLTLEPGSGPWTLEPASGTATTATDGTAAFTFTATAAGSHAVHFRAGTIAVGPTVEFTFAAPLALAGYGLRTPTIGDAVTFTARVTGGLAPFTFERSGDALPAGFTFDAATGRLTGSVAGATPFEGAVTVRDASGQSATQAYRVEPVAPAAAPSAATSTVSVAPTVQVADGTSTVVVTATVRDAASEPLGGIGVTLEPATGAWSVTPELGVATTAADGTAAFTFTATAAGSHAVTVRAGSVALAPAAAFEFVAPLTLSGFGTSAPLVGEEFAFVAQVGGGLAPYAFERTGDPLPAGITFDAAIGELGGTPSTTNPFGGTVTVRDASGQSADQAYRVEPVPPLPNAPVLQTRGQGDASGQGTAASVPWPLRLADGDLVLVVVVSGRPANHQVPGFEVIVRTPAEAALQISAWYRIVSGRPPDEIAVALGDTVVDYAVRSLRVTGQGATDPIGDTSTYFAMDSGDSIVRVPAIRVGNRALLVGAVAYAGGGLEVVAPTGMALAWKTQVSMSTGGAFQQIETAGSTGDRVFRTSAPTGRRRSGILFEIRP
ncbi:MAG: Ig domain-containing protein [Trueperaceae bacterium]|nr:Ig domain-containing protein [Trueperaceae bacterium]